MCAHARTSPPSSSYGMTASGRPYCSLPLSCRFMHDHWYRSLMRYGRGSCSGISALTRQMSSSSGGGNIACTSSGALACTCTLYLCLLKPPTGLLLLLPEIPLRGALPLARVAATLPREAAAMLFREIMLVLPDKRDNRLDRLSIADATAQDCPLESVSLFVCVRERRASEPATEPAQHTPLPLPLSLSVALSLSPSPYAAELYPVLKPILRYQSAIYIVKTTYLSPWSNLDL